MPQQIHILQVVEGGAREAWRAKISGRRLPSIPSGNKFNSFGISSSFGGGHSTGPGGTVVYFVQDLKAGRSLASNSSSGPGMRPCGEIQDLFI